jgi:lysozyme family protein
MTIETMLADLTKVEGGYANDPNDRGGETNHGITIAVARANGFNGPMRDLTIKQARDIYRAVYFNKPGFARVMTISPEVAAELFDTGVNMGPAMASKFFQQALNALNSEGKHYADLTIDGNIGNATITAFIAYVRKRGDTGISVMLKALNCLQGARYITLAESRPANESFLFGWLDNRVELPS